MVVAKLLHLAGVPVGVAYPHNQTRTLSLSFFSSASGSYDSMIPHYTQHHNQIPPSSPKPLTSISVIPIIYSCHF